MRLNRYLAQCGVASRRKADEMIAAGRVSLNGTLVTDLGIQVEPNRDRVAVDGQPLKGPETQVYVALHKPVGTITTAKDPAGRPTVMDLVPRTLGRLYPVGRLDFDSSGLLLLMNDGKLAHRLTHPRYGVEKVYRVRLDRAPTREELAQLQKGVPLEDGLTAPVKTRLVDPARPHVVEVTLHEGRNRQVRRMFEYLGCVVVTLARMRFGTIDVGRLTPGEWRMLTPGEVVELRRLTGTLNG